MSYKTRAELESEVVRIKKVDARLLKELSQKTGESLGDVLHRELNHEKALFLSPEDYTLLKKLGEKEDVSLQEAFHRVLKKINSPANLNW